MKKSKVVVGVILILIIALSLTSDGRNFWLSVAKLTGLHNRDTIADDYDFSVHFIDVGKADSILIEYGDLSFLVDTGTVNSFDTIYEYLQKRNIETLTAMFITHSDIDHIGSAYKLTNVVDVEKIYMGNDTSNSVEALNLNSKINENNIENIFIDDMLSLDFHELSVVIHSPTCTDFHSNDLSLMMKLEYKDLSILLTGDAEFDAENYYMEHKIDLSADVLKVGHHGSDSSSSIDFLNYVNPTLAIICVGENKYNLPSNSVLDNLTDLGIDYLRTDTDGTIIISYDEQTKINISKKDD